MPSNLQALCFSSDKMWGETKDEWKYKQDADQSSPGIPQKMQPKKKHIPFKLGNCCFFILSEFMILFKCIIFLCHAFFCISSITLICLNKHVRCTSFSM